MQAIKGNKKNKIIFYIFSFIFLTTIIFFEKSKVYTTKSIFALSKIAISGYEKINLETLQLELNNLLGQNLLWIQSKDFENILKKNKLIDEFTIKKQYPNKINIELKEVSFVAIVIKNKKKYLLANNNNLILFKDNLAYVDLPIIYGKEVESYFNDFKQLLKTNDFDLDIISSYHFFQINRWDLLIDGKKTIKLPSKHLEEAIKTTIKLLNNKEFEKYSVIDLRINNKIIVH